MSHGLKVALAFAVVYLIWGSTYLAIGMAVETLPPFLLAGVRFSVAGSVLYAVLRLRGAAREVQNFQITQGKMPRSS